jgi:uncharacterized membrane protein
MKMVSALLIFFLGALGWFVFLVRALQGWLRRHPQAEAVV